MTHPYVPNTPKDQELMLKTIGVPDIETLFADIPEDVRIDRLSLPPSLSEEEVIATLTAISRNNNLGADGFFLGAGAYPHIIPAITSHIVTRSEFRTAYTPYQPEIAQGSLQVSFELQSLGCELLDMPVVNAGMYDGATALAEACLMACRITKREKIGIHKSVNPFYIEVVRTYASGQRLLVEVLNQDEIDEEFACYCIQQPAFLGSLLDPKPIGELAKEKGALFIACVSHATSLGMLAPPGQYGTDIAVAEGQSLGVPLGSGGPYIGLFACQQEHIRQMPSRIVGQTKDVDGKTGYVLTLQTREQHIRREKATSNICTSTQLVGNMVVIYLITVGNQLRSVAELCYHKAHYLAGLIEQIPKYTLEEGDFFSEFTVRCNRPPADILQDLESYEIIGGSDVSDQVENGLLISVTELNSVEQIDYFANILEEVA